MELLIKILTFFPNFESSHITLGNLYLNQGRYKEAIVSLKKALKLAPKLKRIHLLLGNAYEGQNMEEEANREYEIFKNSK